MQWKLAHALTVVMVMVGLTHACVQLYPACLNWIWQTQ